MWLNKVLSVLAYIYNKKLSCFLRNRYMLFRNVVISDVARKFHLGAIVRGHAGRS